MTDYTEYHPPIPTAGEAQEAAAGGSDHRLVVPEIGDDFYSGIEWLACWMLDNCEGEEITEEQLRPWAAKAWEEHAARHNNRHEPQRQ